MGKSHPAPPYDIIPPPPSRGSSSSNSMPVPPPPAVPEGAGEEVAEGEAAAGRWFNVTEHLHLGLNLKIGRVYSEAMLRNRCREDQEKLAKLEEFMARGVELQEVPAPIKPPSISNKGGREGGTGVEKRRMPRGMYIAGQIVWAIAEDGKHRPAKIIGIHPDREDSFEVLFLDVTFEARAADVHLGTDVLVQLSDTPGEKILKRGKVSWDGRPEHDFVRVTYPDGSKNTVNPLLDVCPEDQAHITFVRESQLRELDFAELVRFTFGGESPQEGPFFRGPIPRPEPRELEVAALKEDQVVWIWCPKRGPWLGKIVATNGEVTSTSASGGPRVFKVVPMNGIMSPVPQEDRPQEDAALAAEEAPTPEEVHESNILPFVKGESLGLSMVMREAEARVA